MPAVTSCPRVTDPVHGATHWMARLPALNDDMRAGYDHVFNMVHAALTDEDFAMLPQCGEAVRLGQHDHMIIGRTDIGVQHLIRFLGSGTRHRPRVRRPKY
jgi:hypothetical protein